MNKSQPAGVEPLIGSAPPALELENVRKSFGSQPALRGATFTLASAERLALLGPNGAGKTTLIRCLSGRSRPDEGEIRMLGQPIGRPGVRDTLGLVPQEIAIYTDLTTSENLCTFGRFHGLRGRVLRERVRWALSWTGLESRANHLVGTFSGGMKRRVNLACGVLHNPKVLLLDEPTVGVDPQSREKIFRMLEELSDAGTAILLTTHHLDEAQAYSDRIVILDQGTVIAAGTFDQLVEETVGRNRVVRLRVDRPLAEEIEPQLNRGRTGTPSIEIRRLGERMLTARIDDVAAELPPLIRSIRDHGYRVDDVEVQSPSLHHVFLHLTGRQLRD